MHLSSSLIWVLSLTVSTAYGFRLDFHQGSGKPCAGEAIGSWSGNITSGCHQRYAGVAHGVSITPGKNESTSIVAFYDSSDCNPAHLIKKHHMGCSGQSYRSFRVVDRATHFRVDNSNSARHLLRRKAEPFSVRHGDTFEHNGITRRWHQIARGTFSGVRADEWDDEVHQADDDELEVESGADSIAERDVGKSLSSPLHERSWKDGKCMAVIRCTSDVIQTTYGGLKRHGPRLLQEAGEAAKKRGEPLWEFLNKPFITVLEGGPVSFAATVGAMFVDHHFHPDLKPDQAAQCVTEETAKALIEALNRQVIALDKNTAAQQTRVEGVEGQKADVSVAVNEDGGKPVDCDASGNQ